MTLSELFLCLMLVGLFAGILSGIPAMLAIAGVPFVVAVIASFFGAFDLSFLDFFPSRVWGVMSNTLLMAVPLFILMGVVLERSQLAERMLEVLRDMLGASPRGLALSVLLFSALIAASTGIVGATVVMLGLVSLPAMLQAGVSPRVSSGIICASGTLGQIIPPSILLVLLGDQIGNTYLEAQQKAGNFAPDAVSVGDLFAGALVPGLLLVGLYGLYILFTLRGAQKAVAKDERKPVPLNRILGTFLPPLLLIVAVLGSILGGVATTTEAAGLGAIGTILLAAFTRGEIGPAGRLLIIAAVIAGGVLVVLRATGLLPPATLGAPAGLLGLLASALIGFGVFFAGWRLFRTDVLVPAVIDTLRISGMVFGIVIAASMLSLVFRGFGGDELVAGFLEQVPGGKWGALALVMVVVFFLGFILEAVEIIYIVVPLLGAPILATDFSPVWFAVLLAMNLQTSFLTPPFGFALFYYRSVAPRSITTMEIYRSVIPFVAIQLIALALLITFPAVVTWLPDMLFR
ncbi:MULTISPECIES: TRAP transporter large permease subunit [unclassified Nitratireductor]|uniref:TRAP transporter large permease n=1 Tax=unclassified Nitratireductor TaxID=2641084 RepID=UPI0024BD8F11|nr:MULTISPECIES: TRAP transporter large permease subunit [unclassified Nitratireductor]MCV0378669.1 TRAP transporter large permease subunit [Nitratireductor sp.]MDJ1464664.1 TRAP transporter large permease subunit [Nitratireductor sp. GZWM139]